MTTNEKIAALRAAAQAAGARFSTAVREAAKPDAKADAPSELDAIAQRGPQGYATLAKLRLAAADRSAGKTAEALTTAGCPCTVGSTTYSHRTALLTAVWRECWAEARAFMAMSESRGTFGEKGVDALTVLGAVGIGRGIHTIAC